MAKSRMESDSGKSSTTRLRSQRPRILVVDDDRRVAEAIALELDDSDVHIAGNGSEGLDRLREGGRFHLVLCDLMMPVMNGIELYAAVQTERPDMIVRFVFMTGCAFTPSARAFLAKVTNAVIEKPFEPGALHAFVMQLIETLESAPLLRSSQR